jgi:hypothetical protein
MKLTDLIRKTAIGIAVTGALAGSAYAQQPPKTQDELDYLVETVLLPEGSECIVANFAYSRGNAGKLSSGGYEYTASAKPAISSLSELKIQMLYNDANGNGPSAGDKVDINVSIKGMETFGSSTVGNGCVKTDNPAELDAKFVLKNSSEASVPIFWGFADLIYKNGEPNAKRNEYSLKTKPLNNNAGGAICALKLYDPNKNGVDLGDIVSINCNGTGANGYKNSIILDQTRGEITAEMVEQKYQVIK